MKQILATLLHLGALSVLMVVLTTEERPLFRFVLGGLLWLLGTFGGLVLGVLVRPPIPSITVSQLAGEPEEFAYTVVAVPQRQGEVYVRATVGTDKARAVVLVTPPTAAALGLDLAATGEEADRVNREK